MEPVRRFVELFEDHDIARTQIPRFLKDFGISLSLSDINTDEALLHKMDEPLMDKVCEIFAIRREWLDGVESQIYPCHDFYKYPEKFSEFIKELSDKNPNAQLGGILIAPKEIGFGNDALILIKEMIGTIGDKPIYRYHLCNNWYFAYWKARAYLTACIAIAWKQHVSLRGNYLPHKEIERFSNGEELLGSKGEKLCGFVRDSWYPEDMALSPDAFLKGIDPEQDSFGIKSAIELWLKLNAKGFMDAGLGRDEKEAFQQKLKENF